MLSTGAAASHAGRLSSIFVGSPVPSRGVVVRSEFQRLIWKILVRKEAGQGPGLYSGDWRGGAASPIVVALLDDLP
jgi:hypothetical protein